MAGSPLAIFVTFVTAYVTLAMRHVRHVRPEV